jgi:hypothetical protein
MLELLERQISTTSRMTYDIVLVPGRSSLAHTTSSRCHSNAGLANERTSSLAVLQHMAGFTLNPPSVQPGTFYMVDTKS